jgi:chorismate synthase
MDGLAAIIEGFPAGFEFDEERINKDLARRQIGYGTGPRMSIERNQVIVYTGVIGGRTIGSPITLIIPNRDNRRKEWDPIKKQTVPRPGHADLSGAIKYRFDDIRLVAERASARQTAVWTAAGSLLLQFLEKFGIKIIGYTESIGGIETKSLLDPFTVKDKIEKSPLRLKDLTASEQFKNAIDKAKEEGETLGGVITVVVRGVPAGLGSYVHPDRRLDCLLAGACIAIPSVNAIEIGDGFKLTQMVGSETSDSVAVGERNFNRITNHAGGIEGGVSNGHDIVIHASSKPVPIIKSPAKTIDLATLEDTEFPYASSDVCVVPAVAVIAEMVIARIIAEAFLERFGADTFTEVCEHYHRFKESQEEMFDTI